MLRLMLAVLSILVVPVVSRQAALAHHSWKCPPITNVTVNGIGDDKRIRLLVKAKNTCGCRIYLRTCPSDDARKADCVNKWLKAGETWEFTVKTSASDGTAKFDWGTHSNDAPCLK